jgi:hypothetical protein
MGEGLLHPGPRRAGAEKQEKSVDTLEKPIKMGRKKDRQAKGGEKR